MNNLKTAVLMAGLVGLLMAAGQLLGGTNGLLLGSILGLGMNYAAYEAEVARNYGCKANDTALGICKRTVACMEKCPTDPYAKNEACRAGCKAKLAAGCSPHFLGVLDTHSCMPFDSPI